jgi:hypothetical protein
MKILMSSYLFYPSIGGLENVTLLLAEHWQSMGHEVTVSISRDCGNRRQ